MNAKRRILKDWIQRTAEKANGLLVPLSGGVDSSICYRLCLDAFPQKTVGVHAGTAATLRCRQWFESTGRVEYIETPGTHAEREEMRWARLLRMSVDRKAWLVGTHNRTEIELASYSLASRVPSLWPIAGLWKSDLLLLAADIGVPEEIILSSLKADPDCGRPQELAEIPLASIDLFLKVKIGEETLESLKTISAAQIAYLEGIWEYNRFKKVLPICGPRL